MWKGSTEFSVGKFGDVLTPPAKPNAKLAIPLDVGFVQEGLLVVRVVLALGVALGWANT